MNKRYLHVDYVLFTFDELSNNERLIYSLIASYNHQIKDCYITTDYISCLLGISERCVFYCLKRLESLDLIKITTFNQHKRYIEVLDITKSKPYLRLESLKTDDEKQLEKIIKELRIKWHK